MNITATYLDDMTRRCGMDAQSGRVFQRFYSCQHGDHEHTVAISVQAAEARKGDGTMEAAAEGLAKEAAAREFAAEGV